MQAAGHLCEKTGPSNLTCASSGGTVWTLQQFGQPWRRALGRVQGVWVVCLYMSSPVNRLCNELASTHVRPWRPSVLEALFCQALASVRSYALGHACFCVTNTWPLISQNERLAGDPLCFPFMQRSRFGAARHTPMYCVPLVAHLLPWLPSPCSCIMQIICGASQTPNVLRLSLCRRQLRFEADHSTFLAIAGQMACLLSSSWPRI